jgi:DinB superfamily
MDRKIIDEFERGGEKLKLAIRGLTTDDLFKVPVPGKWSTHQVIIHLMDAESAFADRIRRIIATDNPALLAWDENQFAANLHYADQSAEDAITLIDLMRRQAARILKALPDSAFDRTGVHSEVGRLTLLEIVSKAIWHLDHHLKFVAEKREAMGKLVW